MIERLTEPVFYGIDLASGDDQCAWVEVEMLPDGTIKIRGSGPLIEGAALTSG